MNKNYNLFRIGISFLITLVFLIGLYTITYFKAVEIRENMFEEVRRQEDVISTIKRYYLLYPDDRISYQKKINELYEKYGGLEENKCSYTSWGGRGISVKDESGQETNYYMDSPELYAYETYNKMFENTDIGFYSMVKSRSGDILAQYDDFLMVYLYNSNDEYDDDIGNQKVLLLKDNFSEKSVYKMGNEFIEIGSELFSEMDGTYNDFYLYPSSLTLYSETTHINKVYASDNNNKHGVYKISDWTKGNKLWIPNPNIMGGTYGNYQKGHKLYKEARSLCNKFYKELVSETNTADNRYSDNLFTSYRGATGYTRMNMAVPYAFVFHPVNLAINNLINVYAVAFLLLFFVLIICNKLIKKLREQQIAFENNRKELTRAVAHELKTPLGVIKSYTESLKDLSAENAAEYTNIIINEVNHMDKLIQDMLELSRLEAKARTLSYEEVELVSLTKSILNRVEPVIQEQNITLHLNSPSEVILSADLVGIQTVLLNFITNAVKHARSVIIINIQLEASFIRFDITNDGNPIPLGLIDNIWDSFYKEDKARGHQFGSTGLGLSITKNILELHKMQYGCENTNEGVRFWFRAKL